MVIGGQFPNGLRFLTSGHGYSESLGSELNGNHIHYLTRTSFKPDSIWSLSLRKISLASVQLAIPSGAFLSCACRRASSRRLSIVRTRVIAAWPQACPLCFRPSVRGLRGRARGGLVRHSDVGNLWSSRPRAKFFRPELDRATGISQLAFVASAQDSRSWRDPVLSESRLARSGEACQSRQQHWAGLLAGLPIA